MTDVEPSTQREANIRGFAFTGILVFTVFAVSLLTQLPGHLFPGSDPEH